MSTQHNRDNDNNAVKLLIEGKAHKEWSSYDIDANFETPADAWNVTLGLPDGEVPDIVVAGANVQVMVGNDVVLNGQVDEIKHALSRQASLTLNGRDQAAVLLDSSAPIFVAKAISLDEVVAKIVRPLGIKNIYIQGNLQTIRHEKINIEPGMSAWDALERAARANGLWPWFEPDGSLIIGGPDYEKAPVASLFLNKDGKNNNVESMELTQSIAGRYSEVTVLAQSHGVGGASQTTIKGVAKDESMKLHRPHVVIDGDVTNQAEAERKALKIINDSRLASKTLTVKVKGHRHNDEVLWSPGQRIQVVSDVLGLDEVWFLMARRFAGGRGIPTTTTLTLKEDGLWSVDAYKDKAKKGKKGTKGRKKKLTPVVVHL